MTSNQQPISDATSRGVSRRSVAIGAAWAVPAVAFAGAAPAFAASRRTVTGTICRLFYGSGTINYQVHSVYLGVTSSDGIIPAGTVLTWTFTVSGGGSGTGGNNLIPTTNYSANGSWTMTLSQATGTAITGTFTATLTFNADYNTGAGPGGTWCAPALVWTDIYTIRPGASLSVTSTGSLPTNKGTFTGGSLSYTVARRHPTSINTSGRTPHVNVSKSGAQACYPEIQWSRLLSYDGYDNVTTYPAGTTVPNPCTWSVTSCSGTTGLSTPRAGATVQSSQYVTAQLC